MGEGVAAADGKRAFVGGFGEFTGVRVVEVGDGDCRESGSGGWAGVGTEGIAGGGAAAGAERL